MIASPLAPAADYPEELRRPAEGAASACRVCGQRRGKRDADDAWVEDVPLDPRGPRDRNARDEDGQLAMPLLDQPWRWRHVDCEPTGTGVVRSLLGLDVSDAVARRAIAEVGIGTARTENTTSSKPWAFLAPGDADLLRSVVQREVLVGVPRAHISGRCAWCGCSRSRHWSSSGMTWSDGEPAAVCEACADARAELRDPLDLHAVRRRAMRMLAGIGNSFGETRTHGMRLAVEVLPEEHRHDDGRPAWDYSPGLAAVKAEAHRVEAGSILDPDVRDLQLRILAAKRTRARAEQDAEHAAATAEPAIDW